MKKRWIVLGAFVAVIVAAFVVAAMNLDTWLDENRAMIEEEVGSALGRDVDIGDLGVQIWGGLGVRISGLRIDEDASYAEGEFLTLDEGVVRVSILPAIMGRIEIGEIVLTAPDIRVIRDARGLSIDSMMTSAEEPEPAEEASPLDLTISSLRIVDGRVVFEDRTGVETVLATIDHVDLAVDEIGPEHPLSFDLKASLLGSDTPNLSGAGTAGPVLGAADTPLSFDVVFELEALSLEALSRLEDVAASLPEDTRVAGSLDAALTAKGTPEDFAFDLVLDGEQADLAVASDLVKPPGVALALTANGHATPTVATIEAFTFTLAGASLQGEARSDLDETGAWDAMLRGEDVPLAGWGDLLPALEGLPMEGRLGIDVRARGDARSERLPRLDGTVELADVAVRMSDTPPVESLSGRIELEGAKARVRDARFEVGGAPMQLEADIDDLNAPQVRYALDAAVLPLSAVDVLEPGTEADDQLRKLRVVGDADLRTEALVADARFASPEGRLQGIEYTALEGRARIDGARMHLDEMTARMLGGNVSMSGSLDETDPASPQYQGELDLSGVQIAELVKAKFPAAGDVAAGRIDTTLALGAQGLDTDALLKSLAGRGRIDVRDGALRDVNLAEEILKGATGVPGLSSWISPSVKNKHPTLFGTGDTQFRTLGGDVRVDEGRLRTDDFELDTQDYGLKGGGSVGLDGSVDLQTSFTTSPALATSLVSAAAPTRYLLDRAGRLEVPVRITGTVTSLQVRPDEKFLATALKKAAVGTAADAIGGLLRPRSTSEQKKSTQAKPDEGGGSAADGGASGGAAPDAKPSGNGQEPDSDGSTRPEDDLRRAVDDLLGN